MGYGGTGYATVDVDIVQTDVDAIVDGLTGTNDRTLSDLEDRLLNIEGYLYDGSASAIDMLSYIRGNAYGCESYLGGWSSGPLTYMASDLSAIEGYLYHDGYSAAQWLRDMKYDTYDAKYLLYDIEMNLYDSSGGRSAAELMVEILTALSGIKSQTDKLTFDGGVNLQVVTMPQVPPA